MTEPPRRHKRFQIHLSTAVVMMFVAGALIWANVRVNKSTDMHALLSGHVNQNDLFLQNERGFPFTCHVSTDFIINIDPSEGLGLAGRNEDAHWNGWKASVNLLLTLALLFGTWLLCEWLIRRRAARKGA